MGAFITLEGGEGAGKSTQVKRLAARLARRGQAVIVTREPGGSPRAETLRGLILSGAVKSMGPLAETVLFAAARSDHLEATIRPALKRGEWVICDRFTDSTRVYQGALGNVDGRLIRAMERIVVGQTRPQLTLVLDIPADVGLRRAAFRGKSPDRFERESVQFHSGLRERFREIALAESDRCILIDAEPQAETVEKEIWNAVARHFGLA